MRSLLLGLVLLAACGSSPPPTARPAPSDGSAAAGSAAATCPADIAVLVGKPCTTEGASCGTASNTGFSNIVVCRSGTWTQVEVPPPPPGGGAGALACGPAKTCTGTEICITTTASGGAAPPPGQPPRVSTSYECAAHAHATGGSGGYQCQTVSDRQQSCLALLP